METSSKARWWTAIDLRVREREIRRQIRHNNTRRAATGQTYLGSLIADHVPGILLEFLKTLTQSVIGFGVVAWLLEITLHVSSLYTFAVFGLVYSGQATYYKYRLSADPGYRIPSCKCGGRQTDDTEKVLGSAHSATLGVPHSVLGVMFYASLVALAAMNHTALLLQIAILGCCVSASLSYVMIARIGRLCVNCINVSALNVLILVWVVLGI